MKTTPSSTRHDEIALKVATRIVEEVPEMDFVECPSTKATPQIIGILNAELAPLYEQKEELVRVLTKLLPFLQAKGYAEASEAEAALEKAQK